MKPIFCTGILQAMFCALAFLPMITSAADANLDGDRVASTQGDVIIHPINHATLALGWSNLVIYADPVGGAQPFAGLPKPDLIVITHTHPDHLSADTLKAVISTNTTLVAPKAVSDQLPADLKARTIVLTNGETKTVSGVKIEAVPMYNTTAERAQFHPKGLGNGYVLTLGDKRVYLSGDTEDIPEMRALKNIDVAFVCINLPYTMTPDQAASAVREFRPKIVYPYHYKGSDLEKFKTLVGTDAGVEVRLRDWYRP
jgi:L-ascorbate metabolism protein UlaG (beta-lactamase superfamily)